LLEFATSARQLLFLSTLADSARKENGLYSFFAHMFIAIHPYMDKSACTAFMCFTLNLAQHSKAIWALPHFSNAHSHSSWGLQVEPEMLNPNRDPNA